VRDYLNAMAARLAAAAAARFIGGYMPDFDLFAVRDPQINAFSMPGGFIGVNSGLVVATQTGRAPRRWSATRWATCCSGTSPA
jgi:predicted Zn-dependent protease